MWQDFPGFAAFYPFYHRGSFNDLWLAFNLRREITSGAYHVVIWRDVVFRSIPDRTVDTSHHPIELEERREFLERIEGIVLPTWKRRKYDNPGVVDGWSWSLTLRRGQRLRHWEGSNSYPRTFPKVCKHISDLIELPQLINEAEKAYRPA